MRMMRMCALGFLVMVAATGEADASPEDGIERYGVGGAVYSSSQARLDGAAACHGMRKELRTVDAIERIGQGGSIYHSTPIQADGCLQERSWTRVNERIGVGGSTYSSSQAQKRDMSSSRLHSKGCSDCGSKCSSVWLETRLHPQDVADA